MVVIAWLAYRTHTQHLQTRLEEDRDRQFRLTHWRKSDSDGLATVERVLSFADMRLATQVDTHDGGYLADMHRMQRESWEANAVELEIDGWTKDEWMRHGVQVFEVRRLADGTWQTRLIFKYWKARIKKALEPLSFTVEEDFKALTGLAKSEWQERGSFYDERLRPWTNVGDEFAPSIEASYQRYIHAPE